MYNDRSLSDASRIDLLYIFTWSNAKHGDNIVIGLAANSTSKGPQVKTTEPMVSIKVTNCSIRLGWILARDGFAKNYMGSRPEAKKCHFSFSLCVCIYVCTLFFIDDFFHTIEPIKMKLKTYHYFNKMKRWLVFSIYRSTNFSTLFQNFFLNILKMTKPIGI